MNTPSPINTQRQLATAMNQFTDQDIINIDLLSILTDKEVEVIHILSESDTNSPQPPPIKRQKPFHSRTDALIQVLNQEYEEVAEI